MRVIVAVPARLESSRLPGKVLADIGGKPMIQRVLEACKKAKTPHEIVLCTDNHLLIQYSQSWGFKALLTSKECESGSERIASVIHKLIGTENPKNTVIINVQGDQPFIDPSVIDAMANEFSNQKIIPEVLTPIYQMSREKIHNPNIVKTLVAANGQAIYFSRSAIPHVRSVDPTEWHMHTKYWGHVGIYGYRGDILSQWKELPFSPLEKTERLEQLRLIEAGIQVGTFTVEGESLSVDTEEQLQQAREIAKNHFQEGE